MGHLVGPLSSSGLPHPQQTSLVALLHFSPFSHSLLQVCPFEATGALWISPGLSVLSGQHTRALLKGE